MTLWLYRALVRMLPRRVRERDADEMLLALADQIAGAPSPSTVRWRALIRFPRVLALEWRDALFMGPLPAAMISPGASRMEAIARMMRQGVRSLARTPAFSLSVILLLGVGVGSVSAIFAVVDHVLLRSLPYPAADRLIVVENGSHSVPALRDMQAMHSIEAWGAASTGNAHLTGQGEPLRIHQAVVTDGFFPMFGAHAAIGRLLQPADSQLTEHGRALLRTLAAGLRRRHCRARTHDPHRWRADHDRRRSRPELRHARGGRKRGGRPLAAA